jgi:hypothetical protein
MSYELMELSSSEEPAMGKTSIAKLQPVARGGSELPAFCESR